MLETVIDIAKDCIEYFTEDYTRTLQQVILLELGVLAALGWIDYLKSRRELTELEEEMQRGNYYDIPKGYVFVNIPGIFLGSQDTRTKKQ